VVKRKLRTRSWLIIGLLVLLLAAVSAVYVASNQHNTVITVKTNGTDTSVQATSIPFGVIPEGMLAEMNNRAFSDVQSDSSTVNSLKADMRVIAKKYNYTAEVTINSQFGIDQLPFPATVSGTSMVPTLQDGQNIIVLKTSNFKVGDLVVARHPTYNLIVKRVAAIKGDQVYLKSDNRQIEIVGTQTRLINGVLEQVTIEKTPLDTWLPKANVVGVVKVY
jgi:putative alpha-1,2-mannosidase